MGIGKVENSIYDDTPQPTVVKKLTEPVAIATKKLYQTDPKGLLEIIVTVLFLIVAVFVQNWGFYLVFIVWLLVYSNAQEAGYQLYLKIKKQKKWPKKTSLKGKTIT